ncbi:MAG: hypothetical protein ACHQQQ_03165 [Bacteroidota bacterium]
MKNINFRLIIIAGLFAFYLFFPSPSYSQGSAGSSSDIEPRYLVDIPTAGMFPHRTLALDMNYYQNGGILFGVSGGLFNRVILGLSYGGTNIVGAETPVWNKNVGFQFRLRLLEESMMIPAILLGYDSQGKDGYIDSLGRYAIKSLGFYATASKNYKMLGFFSIHGGINYTTEHGAESQHANLFFGAEKTLGQYVSVVGEYNAGFNDQYHDALGKGRGYMNFGLKCTVGSGFTLSFNLKDVMRNQQNVSIGNRTLSLEYESPF